MKISEAMAGIKGNFKTQLNILRQDIAFDVAKHSKDGMVKVDDVLIALDINFNRLETEIEDD